MPLAEPRFIIYVSSVYLKKKMYFAARKELKFVTLAYKRQYQGLANR